MPTVQVFRPERIEASSLRCYDHPAFPEEFSLHTDAPGTTPPEAFGPFRVLHQIGAGALGPVFRAFDPGRERLVAVKLFRLDLPPERVHQLVAELERLIAAGLTHPAVVAPVATGIEGVSAYLAEDYVAAESLDIRLRRGAASIAEALLITTQLAGALDAAAAANVDHGAMHPKDILLSGDEARITGLGIARAMERIGIPAQVRRPYTALERAAGSEWDSRADVFSLAAITHEMLWGRRLAATGSEAAAALTPIAGGDLARLCAVFRRALADDPGDRFTAAIEFAGALTDAFPGVTRSNELPPLLDASSDSDGVAEDVRPPRAQPLAQKADIRLKPDVRPGRLMFGSEPELPLAPPAADTGRFAALDADVVVGEGEKPPVLPPQLMEPPRPLPDSVPADEGSRPTIWPLAFALLIGAALGFAGGFGVGAWGRLPGLREGTAVESTPAPAPAAAATSGSAVGASTENAIGEARRAAAQPAPKPAPAAPIVGSLLVRSTPSGARVFVDNREYGRTPVTVDNLSRGAHSVRLAREKYVTDERQFIVTAAQRAQSMTVRLSPEVPVVASRPPAPSAMPLTVESLPAGATVFLDGRLVGTTPLVVPDVPVGEHALHLDRGGYERWSSAIRIVTSEENRVTASLDR
jgi:hypothetical protein